jgi:hypothetical protein
MGQSGIQGKSIADYIRSYPSRLPGIPGFLSARRQIDANDRARFDLPVDSRGPFVVSGIAAVVDNLHYPKAVAQTLFVEKWEWDVLQEGRQWVRDQVVREEPHLYVTPLGLSGLFGAREFPIHCVLKPSSIIEITIRNEEIDARDVTLVAYGYYPRQNPRFIQMGKMTYLEGDQGDKNDYPLPVGRLFLVGSDVNMDAGADGDLIFDLGTQESFFADTIMVMKDELPAFVPALASVPINVRKVHIQMEGQSQGYDIFDGVDANVLAVFGGSGAWDSRLWDRSIPLEPGSDVTVKMVNLAGAPHTMYGCLVGHRL